MFPSTVENEPTDLAVLHTEGSEFLIPHVLKIGLHKTGDPIVRDKDICPLILLQLIQKICVAVAAALLRGECRIISAWIPSARIVFPVSIAC